MNDICPRVGIIGGGIAGLEAARTLREKGIGAVVLEAADGVGGRTRTFVDHGFRIDSGAIFVMGSYDATLDYLSESGLAEQARRWHARTAVIDGEGKAHQVRFDQPWTLLRLPHLSWRDRVRAAIRLARIALRPGAMPFDLDGLAAADDGTTLAEWARSTFGERVYQYVPPVPLMGPLTGADPEQISSAFTRALLRFPHRVQLTVPRDGVGAIAESLASGLDVRLDCPVLSIDEVDDGFVLTTPAGEEHFEAVVIATDVATAARLLKSVGPAEAARRLREVAPVNAHHVVLGYTTDPWPDAPYDLAVLAHDGQHHNYGVLLEGRRLPGASPSGGQLVSVWFDRAQAPTDDRAELVRLAKEAVDVAYGPAEPDFERVFSWDVALIAPEPGHYDSMRVASRSMPKNLRLAGDFLTHSGIEGALLSGRAGEEVATAVRRTGSGIGVIPTKER